MVIGIDIDDTVAKFKEAVYDVAKEYDKTLRDSGVINEEAWVTLGKYDWSEEEIKEFESFAFESIIDKLEEVEDAHIYINMLKDNGHKIVFITRRDNICYKSPYESTKMWLDRHGFKYDKLIINSYDKVSECKREKVDIFVDDLFRNCVNLNKNKINVIMLLNERNRKYKVDEGIVVAESWREIYDAICDKEDFLNETCKYCEAF